MQLYNQYLFSKLPLKIVVYINRSRINKKIGSLYVIQRQSKTIKKFLEVCTCSIVYMRELEDIQDFFSYTLS